MNSPRTGVVRYPDGTIRAIYGLPANYVVDGHPLASADAASFSDRGGLIAKDGRILLVDSACKTLAEYQSGQATPLLNIDGDLTSAVAWLPSQHALVHWSGSSFILTEVNGLAPSANVSSLELTSATSARLLLTNSDATVSEATVSLESGELTSLNVMPGIRGPAFLQQSFIVFRDTQGVAVATPTSVIQTFPLPALNRSTALTFERMSTSAVHIVSAATGQNWVLHLGKTTVLRLAQLPAEPAILATTTLPEAKQ